MQGVVLRALAYLALRCSRAQLGNPAHLLFTRLWSVLLARYHRRWRSLSRQAAELREQLLPSLVEKADPPWPLLSPNYHSSA